RLTPELQQELAARKAEIRAYLGSMEVGQEGTSSSTPTTNGADTSVGEFPVSFAQRRLWFIDHLEPGNAAYIGAGFRDIHGPIDAQTLAEAVDDVVRKQPSLRTVFREADGEPFQVVQAHSSVKLRHIDLTTLPEGERAEALQKLKQEEATTPFDLATGP